VVNGQHTGQVTGTRAGLTPAGPHRAGGQDVVFVFSTETLADACRREFCFTADQALLALCRAQDRIGHITVANPWRSAPVAALRSLRSLLVRDGGSTAVDRVSLVRPLRLRRRDPTSVPALRRSYRRYDRVLRRHAQRAGLIAPAVLTFNPFVAAFCPLRWAASVTYYAQDDWAAFPPAAPWWPAYRAAYTAIRQRGARLVCVSGELAARVAAGGPAVVIPNGLSAGEWRQPLPPPAAVAQLRRPVVAYAGTIDDRLDAGLIERVAADPAVGSVALIGPCDSGLRRRLSSLPKVTLCGPMARRELAGALMHADACVIPHVLSPLTHAMSPLKLYEYLAAGKPVATTELAPVSGVSERVISAGAGDFVAAVRAALSLPPQDEAARLEFVRANCWDARQERTLSVLLADGTQWRAA
jgi:glycosyltransferase involved in cell wall biosynthesis